MGTEEGRDVYGEGIWVDTMFAWFQLYHDMWGFTKFVVPDVRFRNELAGIQAHGGKVYRIIAPKRVALSPLTEEQRQHPSETDLDGVPLNQFDGVIYNDPEHATSLRMQIHQLNGEPANDDSGEFLVDIFSEVESFANKIFRGKKS
jgi:hypothetical protein